jgi:uncharacterized protein YkwD
VTIAVRARNVLALALCVHAACAAAQARQPSAEELIGLINAYRSESRFCEGKTRPAAGPLAPDASLAGIPLSRDADLQALLRKVRYPAARAQAIVLSGPRDAAGAMKLLRNRYCEAILDAQFAQVGVARDGSQWRLILAQPLLDPDLGSWREAGYDVLDLTNEARAHARRCGSEQFAAAPPVRWNERLAAAARTHSEDMAKRNYFSHAGRDGRQVGARAERAGYEWRAIGENIATGQGSPARVVAGWIASPTHCANLMNPRFAEMGAAYATNQQADTIIYWTQVFGTP